MMPELTHFTKPGHVFDAIEQLALPDRERMQGDPRFIELFGDFDTEIEQAASAAYAEGVTAGKEICRDNMSLGDHYEDLRDMLTDGDEDDFAAALMLGRRNFDAIDVADRIGAAAVLLQGVLEGGDILLPDEDQDEALSIELGAICDRLVAIAKEVAS